MTNTDVSNDFVEGFVYRDDVYHAAKDFLSGYRGEYLFYQTSSKTYILLYDLEDFSFQNDAFVASSAKVYQFDVGAGYSRVAYRLSGTSGLGQLTGDLIVSDGLYATKFDAGTVSVSFSATDHGMVYSSSEGFADLIEGSEFYAFAEILLIASCAVFVLCDMLFRRVSR